MLTINLLPTEEQRAFQRARLERALLRFGLASLLVLLAAAASLLFMKAALGEQLAATERRLQQLFLDERVKAVLEADQAISEFNALLKKVDSEAAGQTFWYKTLAAIAAAAGPGIRLERVAVETGASSVTVSGEAATRSALLAYGDALRAQPAFVKLDAPLTNLIKERDVPFKFTLYLK